MEKDKDGEKDGAVQYSLFFIQRFKGKVLFNVPMSEYTSLKVGGPADVMAFPQDIGDLKKKGMPSDFMVLYDPFGIVKGEEVKNG